MIDELFSYGWSYFSNVDNSLFYYTVELKVDVRNYKAGKKFNRIKLSLSSGKMYHLTKTLKWRKFADATILIS